MDAAPAVPARSIPTDIKRFDSFSKTSSDWDGLRRDSELWLNGDCPVHFYAHGASQRGPSLRVPSSVVQSSGCSYLLEQCIPASRPESPASSAGDTSDSGYAGSESSQAAGKAYELYIPAPADLTREQAFSYHLTTRNYFALLTSKALVGETIGDALIRLLERLKAWHQTSPITALHDYCERLGYSDYANEPSYALAALRLAEHIQHQPLWTEAFAHSVGMHDRLDLSPEYDRISNRTRALISRASLEMDLHIERVIRALGSFLEEELGTEHLGLSKPARDHLDRFRSFLHTYYVDKLGYFPPSSESRTWQGSVWKSMTNDFQSLYSYLVDFESESHVTTDGGVCVLQNVRAFDARHGYHSLQHPLPLLPASLPKKTSPARSTDHPSRLRSFRLNKATQQPPSQIELLFQATNHSDQAVLASPLVQAYKHFERQLPEEKLSPAEARKVRWLLIYSCLQMLLSITRAPPEVRDPERAAYPLCVLVEYFPESVKEDGRPQTARWEPAQTPRAGTAEVQPTDSDENESRTPKAATNTNNDTESTSDRISIHPDCEAPSAHEYFSLSRRESLLTTFPTNTTSTTSTQTTTTTATHQASLYAPQPLRLNTATNTSTSNHQLHRMPSLRQSVGNIQRSVLGSLRRGSRSAASSFSTAASVVGSWPADAVDEKVTRADSVAGSLDGGSRGGEQGGSESPIEFGLGVRGSGSEEGQEVALERLEGFGERDGGFAGFDFGWGPLASAAEAREVGDRGDCGEEKEDERWVEPTLLAGQLDLGVDEFGNRASPVSGWGTAGDDDDEEDNSPISASTTGDSFGDGDGSSISGGSSTAANSPATTVSLGYWSRGNANGLLAPSLSSVTSLASLTEEEASSPTTETENSRINRRNRKRAERLGLGVTTSCLSLSAGVYEPSSAASGRATPTPTVTPASKSTATSKRDSPLSQSQPNLLPPSTSENPSPPLTETAVKKPSGVQTYTPSGLESQAVGHQAQPSQPPAFRPPTSRFSTAGSGETESKADEAGQAPARSTAENPGISVRHRRQALKSAKIENARLEKRRGERREEEEVAEEVQAFETRGGQRRRGRRDDEWVWYGVGGGDELSRWRRVGG
ncbi:hypothetical protein MBLNU230_g5567t1 [Neophaeotheca triangularis]